MIERKSHGDSPRSPTEEFAVSSKAGGTSTPTRRKADYAWTTMARLMSFANDRGIIATNPCERSGRLYAADRKDKSWSEQDIAAVRSVASLRIQLALTIALCSGQRQGDLCRPAPFS
ncbi:hypothetical protein LMTR13_26510 [Bradyrhizobium icense]|uniref:Uncharacterized protein n=1 Tax=Bradyrhizobium icense TaxID=1274631 RepID=A0A1B1UK80_9BRAD|nr:hypothetical protein LMTR13_26510 [Bradyrhizobium icense]